MDEIITINGVKYQRVGTDREPTGWERAQKGDYYYPLSTFLDEVENRTETNDGIDDSRYDRGMYFSDKELAENITRAVSLFLRLNRFAAERQEKELDWNGGGFNWSISYDYDAGDLEPLAFETISDRELFNVYFDSEETAVAALEEFRVELIWYYTEFKNTMRF